VVVKDVSPKDAYELALVENIQRADLNPIEVAEAFDRLLKEHGYKNHEELAARVGKDRTTIVNALRLLKLPARIRSLVISRELSEGHARALLGSPNEKAMAEIADKTVRGKLPVRKVEQLVRAAKERASSGEGKEEKKEAAAKPSAAIRDLEARLQRRLGTRVEVRDLGGRGELAVTYASLDELDRVLAVIGA
jgi:ParB family chromosome partitioning protein